MASLTTWIAHRLKHWTLSSARRVIPFMSERRRAVLRRLVCMRGSSHVAVADALQISRWTVASYRQQLGIDRTAAAIHGAQR